MESNTQSIRVERNKCKCKKLNDNKNEMAAKKWGLGNEWTRGEYKLMMVTFDKLDTIEIGHLKSFVYVVNYIILYFI